ncbi:DUF3772 domain-containing protein [Ponticaulis sp.]|uniref:DUF3772 domain-containing protein n=1 Tax=Ponticaulis sp. TaxID=2020902 RepID=UPI000C4B7BDB|nr:DUF3772 domain-containing protein [Ponticaulis sp.]MBN02815.1 hypothetical protein [Ponticaulis sp.]
MARSVIAFFMLVFLLVEPSMAQVRELDARASQQTRIISQNAVELTTSSPDLAEIRSALARQRENVVSLEAELVALRDQTQDQLSRIGEEVEGESESVSERRSALQSELDTLTEALSRTTGNLDEIDRLQSEIDDLRRREFYKGLVERGPMLVSPSIWSDAFSGFGEKYGALTEGGTPVLELQSDEPISRLTWLQVGAVLVLALLFAIPVRRYLNQKIVKPLGDDDRTGALSAVVGLVRAFIRALPSLLGLFALYHATAMISLGSDVLRFADQKLWIVPAILILLEAVSRIFMSSRAPLPPFNMDSRRMSGLVTTLILAMVSVVGVDHILHAEINLFAGVEDAELIRRGIVAILLAGLVFFTARVWKSEKTDAAAEDDEGSPLLVDNRAFAIPGVIRTGLTFLSVVSLAGALFGYEALAHFVMTRVVLIGGLLLLALIARAALKQIALVVTGRVFRSKLSSETGADLIDFWVSLFVDILVIAAIAPIALLLVGLEWEVVRRILTTMATGFSIGPVRISVIQILIAIAVFVVLVMLTRFVQRTAEKRVLSRLRVDQGIQTSLKTLIGYVGLVIAFITGVSMLGFDLSSLAIIAGALSVGIGFGLQSIVNNFVSGLILLFERPIKVGDWVVTSSGEGIVKKISVRSTEIETFERSSILVPNSELIANSVTNWTHKNRLGRVNIPVGVSYNEDPDRIIALLESIPAKLDDVLEVPEPQVLFMGFGDSSLDFELRVFIADVQKSIITRSKVRVEIFKLFRDENVEIPFPQRDLHIRSSDIGDLNTSRDDKKS